MPPPPPARPFDVLICNTSSVLQVTGDVSSSAEVALAAIPRGAVGLKDGRVEFLGPEVELPAQAREAAGEVVNAQGGLVGPGFVDPHTHIVFGGERANEFDLRCQGKSYLDIAKTGGGIMSTVTATRAATAEELAATALPRLGRLLEHGVTTAEVKSGYGLTLADELKLLQVVRKLGPLQPVELVPTLLCAHAIPAEFKSNRRAYVDLCVEQMVPEVATAGLAKFCDAFAEDGAWTLEEARRILEAAAKVGLTPKVHADQLSDLGACRLAAEVRAASADHLEQVTSEGISALQAAGVVAVLLPTATLFLKLKRFAPGRQLWDAGVRVALATNVNPGSAMSENHALTLGLACLENGLSASEAYWAATRGAAMALRLPGHGQLAVGGPGDAVVFSCSSVQHLPYHLGVNHVRTVVKSGRVVVQRRDVAWCG